MKTRLVLVVTAVVIIGLCGCGSKTTLFNNTDQLEPSDNFTFISDRYYLNSIALPSDYPEDSMLPATSYVEFPDGLVITVDFTNTQRYKDQLGEY